MAVTDPALSCSPELHGSKVTLSQGSNTMAVKDGAGPAARSPECQTLLSEPTRNWGPKPWLYPRQLRSKLESKDPVAGLKHHGSEGRACVVLQLAFVLHGSGQGTPSQGSNTMAVKDGAGPRPVAQSAKRYSPRNWVPNRLALPRLLCCHRAKTGSEGRIGPAASQGSKPMAVTFWTDYRGPCPGPNCYSLNRQETEVQGPCRRAKTPWQWRTDWARGP